MLFPLIRSVLFKKRFHLNQSTTSSAILTQENFTFVSYLVDNTSFSYFGFRYLIPADKCAFQVSLILRSCWLIRTVLRTLLPHSTETAHLTLLLPVDLQLCID